MRWVSTAGFWQILPPILGYSSMESRSGDAPKDEELDVPTEGWKIGVPIGYPYDVMAER
jgi:hypothetical protein